MKALSLSVLLGLVNFQQDSSFEERKAGAAATQYSSSYIKLSGGKWLMSHGGNDGPWSRNLGIQPNAYFNVVVVVLPKKHILNINRFFFFDETVRLKKIVLKSSSDVFVFQRLKNERFSQWDCLQVAFLLYDESVTFVEIKNLIYSLCVIY